MTNPKLLPIIDNKDLVRDTRSKAILSTNIQKLQEHRSKKQFLEKLMRQGEDVEDLKKDVNEIKELLYMIIKNK